MSKAKKPATKKPAKRQPPKKSAGWNVHIDSCNGGAITYRCIAFNFCTNQDDLTDSELQLLDDMIETLNRHFDADHPDPPDDEP